MFRISSARASCAARILLASVVDVSDFSHTRVPKLSPPKRRRDRNAIRVVEIRSSSRVNPASPLYGGKEEARSVIVIVVVIVIVAVVVVIGAGFGIKLQRRKLHRPQAA